MSTTTAHRWETIASASGTAYSADSARRFCITPFTDGVAYGVQDGGAANGSMVRATVVAPSKRHAGAYRLVITYGRDDDYADGRVTFDSACPAITGLAVI